MMPPVMPDHRGQFSHVEAFCLMRYQDEVTLEVEVIWNSRDGVTPFMTTSRAGHTFQHVEWSKDLRAINHTPKIGDRIFVDLTEARAREKAREHVEFWWDHPKCPMHSAYATKEAAIEETVSESMTPGAPDLIEVTAEWLGATKRNAEENRP